MYFRAGMFFYTMNTRLLGLEYMKELYDNDSDFVEIYNTCGHSTFGKFYLMDDFCLKRIDCVFLLVLCVNCLFVKHMGAV